jgi:oligo-alginate lyase
MGTVGQSGSRAIGQSGNQAAGRGLRRVRPVAAVALLLIPGVGQAQAQHHPSIFITKQEAAAIRTSAAQYPLLERSLAEAKQLLGAMARPIDVPQPGEAGGYAHEKHKQNYRELQLAGVLFQITGDVRYARYVRDVLEAYARLYPTLGAHPLNKNQSAGKLFHQALNEANWLVAVSIAYDCVYEALTPAERTRFERNVLRPMASWLSEEHPGEFDRIHNHGTWATAAVGMLGYVLGDTSYVNRALYGTKRDKTGGFIRQLDLLFSPDGYYMEGPYYIRYALMPFYHFAEAIERRQPELGIYRYRNGILQKGLYSAVATAFPNGVFPPINDASRTMDIVAPEVVLSVDLAYQRFGANPNLLGAAAIQNRVILNGAGLAVARDMAARAAAPAMNFGSIEFTDGPDGRRGGLGILRSGEGQSASMLLMKYGVHGQGHGHFDKLHFSFFDGGREVVPDYGFSRWINIEPKYGGRYLPENDSYAMQTIAHNTVVVDQRSQNDGKEDADEAVWGERHFFDAKTASVQVMSARADRHYPGIAMQRTMFLIRDARLRYPVVLDLYRLESSAQHSYDYPLHFRGQLIAASVKYDAQNARREPLGTANGYQHIWKEATATTSEGVQLTWLDGNRYYTMTAAGTPATEVIFGRTGGNDPNFNLTVEPLVLLRRNASNHVFASVIEPHGYFNEAQERSEQARPRIQSVRVLGHNGDGSAVEVTGEGLKWLVLVTNRRAAPAGRQQLTVGGQTYEWNGNYEVRGVQGVTN